jgi:hypothetical protein
MTWSGYFGGPPRCGLLTSAQWLPLDFAKKPLIGYNWAACWQAVQMALSLFAEVAYYIQALTVGAVPEIAEAGREDLEEG